MFKKVLFACSLVACLLFIVACKPSDTGDSGKDNKNYPRFSDISILESVKEEGAIDVFVKAKDTDTSVNLIVVAKDSKAPTHENIRKHEAYDGVEIVSHLEGTGTIYKTIQGLEQATAYDIYVTLFKNDLYAKEFYKTTCLTKTLDEVLDKGSGTNEDPYKIFSIEDLEKVASDAERLTAYYSLQNDIDLSSKYGKDLLSFVPLSWQTGSLKAFNGYFNGNGHTIKNLYISETKESVGLFGQLGEEGTVANLILENPVVSTTGQRLGAVVGYNKGSVINVSVVGGKVESLVPAGGQAKAGGLVGDMYESGSILRCVSKTTVIAAGNNVGGISGSADASTGKTKALEIKNSYSLSDVTSYGKYVGGIVGYARCVEIENCYTLGTVEGGEGVGGIVGLLQQRSGSSIVPTTKNCFVLGTTITANGASQSNNSGLVVGNRSTSNNTNPIVENLYYADTTLLGNQKKPQSIGEEVEASVFANKEWLKTNVNIECNDVYWTMKSDASRPTLVHAGWDEGLYKSPLQIRNLKASAIEQKQISLEAESSVETGATIYYMVVLSKDQAPTAEQIIAQKDYDTVKVKALGSTTEKKLETIVDDLQEDTSYTIYAVVKTEAEVSKVASVTQKTLAAPIILATSYEVKDGAALGEINILITSNKNVTTYYKVSKEQLTLTKEDMLTFDSTTTKTIKVEDLDENTDYFIYVYSKTSDEDVEITELTFKTTADPVPFEVTIEFSKTVNAKELLLTLTTNKANASIWYILSKDLSKEYTKEEIMTLGELYSGDAVKFNDLEDNTEYKIFVYGKTATRETEVQTEVATTLDANYEQFADYFVGDWNQPGLYDKNGAVHQMPAPVEETGKVISVATYGAIANDATADNYEAFKKAIDAAEAGDVVYIPNGTYYFTTSLKVNGYYAHIHLKPGITLKGESKEGVVLVSCFTPTENEEKSTTVIAVTNASNVAIKNLTVTSNTGELSYDINDSNLITDILTGPKYGITIASSKDITSADQQTKNVLIDGVIVEKFRRSGVRIAMAQEVTVRNSTFRYATCLGGGGMGYGVCIQGETHDVDGTDTILDTRFNVVEDCTFEGPYLRHGVLIQYYAHNNLVHHNTFKDILLDSIDLHGEDEYSNEICHNEILNTRRGAAVGLGNTGATHDATGRNNFIHDNLIDGGARAIDIMLDTPNTVIFANTIKNVGKGITCSLANGTRIVGNTLEGITEYGVRINYAFIWGATHAGIPSQYTVKDNTFISCGQGIYIETIKDSMIEGNQFEQIDNANQVINTTESFEIPQNEPTISIDANDEEFSYNLVVSTNKTDVKVYYLLSTLSTAPTKEEVLAQTPSDSLTIALEGLKHGTVYNVYVVCVTGSETSVMLSTSFETAEAETPVLSLTAKLTTNQADGVVAKYAQAGATFETTEGATVHYVLTDSIIENPTVELLNSSLEGKFIIRGETEEGMYVFTGLTSATKYYLYCYATLEDSVSSIVTKEVTTAQYRNFNRDVPAKSTINIFNAEDFYKYIEFSTTGLIVDETAVLNKPSASAKVTLFGDIYLDGSRNVTMITDAFKGVFDGQGFTIYNLYMESDSSENLGLFKVITGSGATAGTFKNTNFVNANIVNTFAGTTTSNAGNGIICSELRGIIENVVIKDSKITVSQDDSRLGAIVGRFTNYKDGTYTAHISNCGVYNTVVSGGSKNIGGAIGYAAYASAYTTSEAGTAMYVSDLYVSATVQTTSTQSSVGGVIGVSEILVKNVVSDTTVIAAGKERTYAQILGTIQNSTKETSIATISSCISYKKGTLVRNWKPVNNVIGIAEMCYEIGTVNSDTSETPKQSVVALEEITAQWITENTTFDIATENSLWVLEENQLNLRLGGNI